jgi:hypothetical protein
MRVFAILVLAALAAAPPAHGQGSAEDRAKSRTSIPYGGGGIRGNSEVVADGVLATPSEAGEFRGDAPPPQQRTRSLVPGIELLRPAPQEKAKPPFVLAVRFRPAGGTRIVPSTLKVLYGAGRLDITDRVVRAARVSADGFTLDQAQLPPGRHQLLVQVQDDRQRTLEGELRLEVE